MAATTLPSPPAVAPDWALFLDVDGTLLDFAQAPGDVHVDPGLLDTLAILHGRLDGALALISGRTLAQLDALFAPLHLPAVGLHGLERRDDGHLTRSPRTPALDVVIASARALAGKYPGALVEDKGTTVALHWRGASAADMPVPVSDTAISIKPVNAEGAKGILIVVSALSCQASTASRPTSRALNSMAVLGLESCNVCAPKWR